jgi:hypothetical protein
LNPPNGLRDENLASALARGSATSALRPSSPSVTKLAVSGQLLVAALGQIPMAANSAASAFRWRRLPDMPKSGRVSR